MVVNPQYNTTYWSELSNIHKFPPNDVYQFGTIIEQLIYYCYFRLIMKFYYITHGYLVSTCIAELMILEMAPIWHLTSSKLERLQIVVFQSCSQTSQSFWPATFHCRGKGNDLSLYTMEYPTRLRVRVFTVKIQVTSDHSYRGVWNFCGY